MRSLRACPPVVGLPAAAGLAPVHPERARRARAGTLFACRAEAHRRRACRAGLSRRSRTKAEVGSTPADLPRQRSACAPQLPACGSAGLQSREGPGPFAWASAPVLGLSSHQPLLSNLARHNAGTPVSDGTAPTPTPGTPKARSNPPRA